MALAALFVSLLALAFTVASFWWLQARPGTLRTYEPATWAGYLTRERSGLRLPLVLHNNGATATVVLALRVRFLETDDVLEWEWTRKTVDPRADDVEDVARPMSIPGGGTREIAAEFVGSYPGTVPEQRPYSIVVEARTAKRWAWTEALTFDLQLGNFIHPARYIVYSNRPDYLTDRELTEGADNLNRMRTQLGLDADRPEGE